MKMRFIILLLVGYCYLPSSFAADEPPAARVVTAAVTERVVSRSNHFSGIVNFVRVSGVSSEVGGVVEKAPQEAGTLVKKDALLARINTDFVKQDIRITRREMGEVDAQLNKQKSILKRRKALIANNATSQDAYDDAFYNVQALQRQLETFKAQIQRKELEISKSKIRAPFEGLVLETFVEQGEAIAPQTAVARVAAISDVEVSVSVAQSLLKFQQAGTKVSVTIDALERQLTGTIKRAAPMVDVRSKNIVINIAVPYTEGMLQNMGVSADLPVSDPQSLRLISRDAVVNFQGGDFIYTVVDAKASLLPINIVTRLGEFVGVDNANIVAGMPVVIDGNDRLRPDQSVEVIEASQ